MLRIIGLVGLLLLNVRSFSHPADVCLERVADSSEMLKICQLNQRQTGECDAQKAFLQRRIEECQAALFTDEDIASASREGAGRIEGDIEQSDYRRTLYDQQTRTHAIEGNIQSFRTQFPELEHIDKQLTEHFDTDRCPNQYEGAENRWNLAKVDSVSRFPLGNVVQGSGSAGEQVFTLYFMVKEVFGKCYSAPEWDAAENHYVVVSMPDQVYQDILVDSEKRVLICEDHLCVDDFKALESLYRAYREQYQEFLLYAECSRLETRNKSRLRPKRQPAAVVKLPDSCPVQGIDNSLKRSKERLELLDRQLFGAATVQLVDANSL